MNGQRFDQIIDLLRKDGGRITATRKLVVRAILQADDHHTTATDITNSVRDLDPDFQESTVYRTLERLTDLGVIHHVHIGHGAAVYHLTDHDHKHHHLLCNQCNRVIEVPPSALQTMTRRIDRDTGFLVDPGHFALTGTCANCRHNTQTV